jgi:hypothetical protein
MNHLDQFCNELDRLVCRYRQEADFSYAEIIGALNMRMWTLMHEAQERADEVFPDISDLHEEDEGNP